MKSQKEEYQIKHQTSLERLIIMSEPERLKSIIENRDTILSDEYITFMKGQIEFAESMENGAGYFDKVYVGEDISFLNFMKKEMEKHAVNVDIVWKSMKRAVHYLDEKLLFETGLKGILTDHFQEISSEAIPCYKCSELSNSHGLCNGCLHTGKPPETAKQNKEIFDKENIAHIESWVKRNYKRIKKLMN